MDSVTLNSYQIYRQNMSRLIEEKYQRLSKLPQHQYENILSQLYWVQENKKFTPQADALYNSNNGWTDHLNREICRALCRIEMLLLLREVNDLNSEVLEVLYEEFTREQSAEDKLKKESFLELARQMQNLDPTQVNAQIYASVIASITLSPQAIQHANQNLGEGKWPYDSVQFSGHTIRRAGNLYPIYNTAAEDERLILQHCFPDDSRHWRHAFFLENVACLDPLKEQLIRSANSLEAKKSAVTECQNWLTYWFINALGFEGHVKNMQGSHFMTESVFQRAILLNSNIQRLFEDANLDVLAQYSEDCLKQLDITVQNTYLAIFIMKLANMTNIFNKESVGDIHNYIKENKLLDICHLDHDIYTLGKIATYVPGFLQNVYRQAPKGEKIASIVKALHWANTAIKNSEHKTTSFMKMNTEQCATLMANNFEVHPCINEKGEIDNITALSSPSKTVSFSA